MRLDELGYTDLSDSLEEMKLRAKEKGFAFPYLYDGEKQAVSRACGVQATPHVFIFDQERKLRYVGRIDDAERGEVKSPDARHAIEALLAGKARAGGSDAARSDARRNGLTSGRVRERPWRNGIGKKSRWKRSMRQACGHSPRTRPRNIACSTCGPLHAFRA